MNTVFLTLLGGGVFGNRDQWIIDESKDFAGLPAATTPAGTSVVTTLPAPMTVRSPIVTLRQLIAVPPMHTSQLIVTVDAKNKFSAPNS